MRGALIIRFLTLAFFMCAPMSVQANFRVSFLNDPGVLEDTINRLRAAGTQEESLGVFRNAVLFYYRAPLAVDTSAFPPLESGFYDFDSGADFVSALSHPLSSVDRYFQINCFDTALLLARGQLTTTLDARDCAYPLYVPRFSERGYQSVYVATPQEFFNMTYSTTYTNFVEAVSGMTYTNQHQSLTASFFAYRNLPREGIEQDECTDEKIVRMMAAQWEMRGIEFSENLQLVMLHYVDYRAHAVVTDHAGLLIPNADGYMYVEKAGGCGPFLRIDLDDPTQLLGYFDTMHGETSAIDEWTCFVSVNDQSLGQLSP